MPLPDSPFRRLDATVHKYVGDDDSEVDEIDPELAQYTVIPQSKGKLGEFMDLAPSSQADGTTEDSEVDTVEHSEWTCTTCTFVNRPSFLCCEMCTSHRAQEGN